MALTNLGYRDHGGAWWHSDPNRTCVFLGEFPIGETQTKDAIGWMKTLPLFIEFDAFRVVHACWNEAVINQLGPFTRDGVLSDNQLIEAADETGDLFRMVETTTKGPELPLPRCHAITDKDGTVRHDVRVKWWSAAPSSWAEIAISVPDLSQLPGTELLSSVVADTYPANAQPVFFGHYWLEGTPVLQAANAPCLDYSAGKDGPLVSYCFAEGSTDLDLDRLTRHPIP